MFFPHSFPHARYSGFRNQAMRTYRWVSGCGGFGHQRSEALNCLQYPDRSRLVAVDWGQSITPPLVDFTQPTPHRTPTPPKLIWVPYPCLYTMFCTNDDQVFENTPHYFLFKKDGGIYFLFLYSKCELWCRSVIGAHLYLTGLTTTSDLTAFRKLGSVMDENHQHI